MTNIGNLTLIGTSHISKQSKKEVIDTIKNVEPAIVAIELDFGRLQGLMSKEKKRFRLQDIRKIGIRGFLFAMFGSWAQKRLGKMVGAEPGQEMKAAVIAAAKVNAKVALIDQEITKTIRKLFKTITFKEKMRFVGDIIKGVIFRQQEIGSFDLHKVPPEDLIEKIIEIVRQRYPSFYKVLIEDRNKYMSRKIINIMKANPDAKVVAVVGAGHKKGMIEILEKAIFSD